MLYPQANEWREKLDLSGLWDFMVDPDDAGEREKWFDGLTDGVDIAVPGSWNEQFVSDDFPGIDIKNYLGAVWYQKRFFVPVGWEGKKIWLRIGAANYRAKVWVNGIVKGEGEGGYFPFEFDVTDDVHVGRECLLVVRVNNELSDTTLPQNGAGFTWEFFPNSRTDYFPYGGIHRPVVVYCTSNSYVEHIAIDTDIDGAHGIVRYNVAIAGEGVSRCRVSLAGASKDLWEEPAVSDAPVSGELTVEDARFWCPDDPYLYAFQVRLFDDDGVIDEYTFPVGIRTVRVSENGLALNGKRIILRSIGKHEDSAIIGKGLSLPVMIKDYALLRWVGANGFRCNHYPYAEEMMQLADKKGLLVIAEVPGLCMTYASTTEAVKKTHQKMLSELISRDRNHPSVVMWVVGNEPMNHESGDVHDSPPDHVLAYYKELAQYTKSLDPSRPITMMTCCEHDEALYEYFDVISRNRYKGWYLLPGRAEEGSRELGEEMDAIFAKWRKPILISEFGAEAIAGEHAESPEMWTEEYQAKLLEALITTIESKDYAIGSSIWSFADFKVPQSVFRTNLHRKGIFTRDRQPKMGAHKVRELWKTHQAQAPLQEPPDALNEDKEK